MRARRWTVLLWTLTGLIVAVLLLKTFVMDVYSIDSVSMRPTLFGGRVRADGEDETDHVLVLYDRDLHPQRFDLVVFRAPDGTKPLVKRVVGLPGDRDLMIRDGDLFVGRKRLPPDAPRPAPIPVYDDRYLDPERFFEDARDGSVRREGDAWVVTGGPQAPGSLLLYHVPLRDDYFDRRHRWVPGVVEVNDAVLELEFLVEAPLEAQTLRFRLVEEGDTFEAVIEARTDGTGSARLLRTNESLIDAGTSPQVLAETPVRVEAGRWYALRFANIDNHLHATVPELGVDLARSYDRNEPWRGALPPGERSLGSRVRFGAQSGTARFRAVRILRDLFYTDEGVFGATQHEGGPPEEREAAPLSLGPDEYFVLGDNSAASTDSRQFGAIPSARLIGTPVAVVWPEWHRLHAVGPPE